MRTLKFIPANELKVQNSVTWRTGFTYTPRYYYRVRKGRKQMSHSGYPKFSASIEQGVSAFGSEDDYLFLEGGVRKENEADFRPAFSWAIDGGWFARNEQMHFSRFKHFNASLIPVKWSGGPAFYMLNDYQAATNQWYVRGYLKFTSPYLLLKYLPVLSNRIWQESLHLNYLHNPRLKHYTQLGYSVDRVFLMGSVGVFAGFEDGAYKHWGVRGALEF